MMTQNEQAEKNERNARAFHELVETVARLRAPDGCPWDRTQTHVSLKPACIEEAAEVICGINILTQTGRSESLCEELGDLLLQVLMHALIAEEEGIFTLEDVMRTLNAKMIRRHPHVFGKKSLEYLPEAAKELLTSSHKNDTDAPENTSEAGIDMLGDTSEADTDTLDDMPESGTDIPDRTHKNKADTSQDFRTALIADWKKIKSFEKQGREWEEDYLFEAFTEAEHLIDVARKRKQEKQSSLKDSLH